ncbi:MAG: ABC transporter ATP-binding protein [Candidatus Hodarchaeales archaeon]
MDSADFVACNNLFKIYTRESTLGMLKIAVLKGLDLHVKKGEFISILGPSGSGKTTLLRMISGIDTPSTGEVHVNGLNLTELPLNKRLDFRRKNIGLLKQSPKDNVFLGLTCLENLLLAIRMAGKIPRSRQIAHALDLLDRVNLRKHSNKRVNVLSGGESQRLGLIMALSKRPSLLLLDEPTGNLDRSSSITVFDYISELHNDIGFTTITVTHNEMIANLTQKKISINDGRIAGFIHTEDVQSTVTTENVYINDRGVITIPSNMKSILGDFPYFIIERKKDEIILIPILKSQAKYFRARKTLLTVDNGGTFTLPADIILNYNIRNIVQMRLSDNNLIIKAIRS